MSEHFQIAIDGPTASGKGTVARLLAKKFDIANLYTGALYRAITIHHMNGGTLDDLKLEVKCVGGRTHTIVNGEDITKQLHRVEVSETVPEIAQIPQVRQRVRQIQSEVCDGQNVICEGRDITSVVFPKARFKFFLTASLAERARRRYLQEKKNGEKVTFESVQKGIAGRDHADMTREKSPLKHVKGAILIDATEMTAQEVADKMESIIRKELAKDEKKSSKKSKKNIKTKEKGDFYRSRGATLFRLFLKIICLIPYHLIFWSRVINRRELKQHRGKPVIFAVNHRSYGDVVALFTAFPSLMLHFIGKESLFKPRTLMNWFLRCLNGVPIRPGKNDIAIIRHCLGVLKKNEVLVMFPEGTRSFSPEDALALRNGTAVIAMKAGVPIVPIVSKRAVRAFTPNAFKVGKTIWPSDFTDKNELSAKLKQEMGDMLEGFEVKPKLKKWQKEPIYNSRIISFIDDKLVAIKRNKGEGDYYIFPGGHVDEGESARDAAVRELKEETNIDSEVVRVLYRRRFDVKGHKEYGMMQGFFLCRYVGGEVSKTDAEEYQDTTPTSVGRDGRLRGMFEPVLLDIADLPNIEVRPAPIKEQLVKDLKKYGTRLTRPTKYIK